MRQNAAIRRTFRNRSSLSHQAAQTFLLGVLTLSIAALSPAAAQQNAPANPRPGMVGIDSRTVLLVDPAEPGPVLEAARDLAADFEKVFGKRPAVVDRQQDAAPVTIVIGSASSLVGELRPASVTQPESFAISVSRANWNGAAPTSVIALTGADMRGAMYAVYQFSEEYLGVDPLYYWTGRQPVRRAIIEVPSTLSRTFPAPVIKYRGFFINDEDLLTGWAPAPKAEGTGISLEAWNKIYETILRLKGNMVAPGTWIFPDEPQIQLAGKRGLIVTQHHAIPLGMNVARWPKDVPYSYSTHPEILERAWKNAVAAYPPGVEVLWTVGLRGLSDVSYAVSDPSVANDNRALGRLISKAIATQMKIVRARNPDAQFITNLWQEGARLVQQGDVTIPQGVGVVWADDGWGYLQDKGLVAAGQGAYYHVAMMNGRTNQLTEMVPVSRIDGELGRYIKAGATNYMLVNTSDIRPVVMTARAIMDLSWKGLTPEMEDTAFYRRWSAYEFGEKAAGTVSAIYKDYFATPAHPPGEPVHEYGEQFYHTQARLLMLGTMMKAPLYSIPGQSPLWQNARILDFPGDGGQEQINEMAGVEAQRCGAAQPRWDALWNRAIAAEQLVPPDRRPFYRAHVLATVAISREGNRVLTLVADAVRAAGSGQKEKARAAAQQALAAVAAIRAAEAAAEYGKFKNWYRGDWLTNVTQTHDLLTIFLKQIDDPLSPLPPPVIWNGWEAYYHIRLYQGRRTVNVGE